MSMASQIIEEGIDKTYWELESKTCDVCKSSPSILYCRADAAFLCGACDAGVHSANKLASRHDRVWLCEVCKQAPAAVTCKADSAALCIRCDADIHSANPLARRHDRRPVVPFYHSVNITNGVTGVKKCFEEEEVDDLKSVDYFFSDVDPYLDLDYADSVVPMKSAAVAMAVLRMPPQLQQPVLDFDFGLTSNAPSCSMCSSEVGVVPDGKPEVSTMTVMDREARVMRYREKRKNRKFEKTIRYASRKAYAETRPRIKGRFAKRTEVEIVDGGYGVVPSF